MSVAIRKSLQAGLASLCVLGGMLAFAAAPALAAAPEAPSPITPKYVGGHSVFLGGFLNPNKAGEAGTYEFLYRVSATECKGESNSAPEIAMGRQEEEVDESIGNLLPDTTYTVCLLDKTPGGETAGPALTFKTALPPETPETLKAEPVHAYTATLRGALNPKHEGEAGTYEFVYRKSGATPAECQGEGETKTTPTASQGKAGEVVSSSVAGLTPTTEYTYCVIAENKVEETAIGAPETFTTPAGAPTVVAESTTEVEATSATLNATVDPGGAASTYRFEYDAGSEYAPVPGGEGSVGSGTSGVPVSVHVQTGLLPSTSYHFRVTATNSVEAVPGEGQTFTTQSTGGEFTLPDNRAWEQVTPVDKHGASVEPLSFEGSLIQSSELGGAIAYVTQGSIVPGAGNRSGEYSQDLARRGPSGWTTESLDTPNGNETFAFEVGYLSEYKMFSNDLSQGLAEPLDKTPLPPLPASAEETLYLRNDELCDPTATESVPSTCYTPLVTEGNVLEGAKFGERYRAGSGRENNLLEFKGASPDLSHIVFSSKEALTPGAARTQTGTENLYEWAGGQLQLVSVLPDGVAASASEGGEGASLGFGGNRSELVRNAVSNDGSRVVWSSERNGQSNHLYLTDSAKPATVQLDVPEEGAESELQGSKPIFQGAGEEGTGASRVSRVFFTDEQRLTTDSQAEGGRPDLYVAEVTESGGVLGVKVTDLTVDANPGEPGFVQRDVLGYSEDGSYVYFAADGELAGAAGAAPGDCEEEAGHNSGLTCDLYVEHFVGGSWQSPRVVARVSDEDEQDWAGNFPANLSFLSARVSPDGNYLAFMSSQRLTGYDNQDAREPAANDEEVYLFNASAGSLTCASCDPSGARPLGVYDPLGSEPLARLLIDHVTTWIGRWLAGSVPGWTPVSDKGGLYQSRYLSNSGRLFFDSPDALVPSDGNGLEDVYEYEPEGVGPKEARCGPEASSESDVFKQERAYETAGGQAAKEPAGCVALISSGTSSQESAFLDASGEGPGSEEGEDVFFLTAAQLNPQDTDSAYDIYDAHTCSAASPCPAGAGSVPPACSDTDSCRAASAPQPAIFGAPATATFSGAGNVAPPPAVVKKVTKKTVKCKRGFTKKKSGCVKNKKSKRAKKAGHGGRTKS